MGYRKKFENRFSEEFMQKISRIIESYNSGLPALYFEINGNLDRALTIETLRAYAFSIFPKKILKHGILLDDKSSGDLTIIELRYAKTKEERQILKSAPVNLLDFNRR